MKFDNYEEKNAIELLVREIETSLNNKMYYAALIMSLIIPDVLGKIEYGEECKSYYSKWFNANVRDTFGLTCNELKERFGEDYNEGKFDGNKCYELRCSLFHSAATDIEQRARITEFVIQLSDEQFVRGINYDVDYDYNNIVVNEDGTVSNKCRITKMYISANEIVNGIVNATKIYMYNNKEKVDRLNSIKINEQGGAIAKTFFNNAPLQIVRRKSE